MLKRAVRLVAINLLVLGLMAESLALVAFYVGTGWIFYAYPFRPFYRTTP